VSASAALSSVAEYQPFKRTVNGTKLPGKYSGVNYLDSNSFFDSLKSQGSLGESWMTQAWERFAKWLGIG